MPESDEEQRARRLRMVEDDIASRGVTDDRVLDAMRLVPRERFVPEALASQAYDDGPLPIGRGQTISQPYMVAAMAEAAEITPSSRVLEVGTGCGYGAAVLARLAASVWTVERLGPLVATAAQRLRDLGVDNVRVVHGDGSLGLANEAPFDAIVVTAAARDLPDALVEQLVDGGRLIIPVGPDPRDQQLVRVRRLGDATTTERLGAVRFVPLVPGCGTFDTCSGGRDGSE